MKKARKHRDIIERYCSHVDDNVIMIKKSEGEDRYECLSSQLCRDKDISDCDKCPEAKQ